MLHRDAIKASNWFFWCFLFLLILMLSCCGSSKSAVRHTGTGTTSAPAYDYEMQVDEGYWDSPARETIVESPISPMESSVAMSKTSSFIGDDSSKLSSNSLLQNNNSTSPRDKTTISSINLEQLFIPKAYAAENTPDERYLIRDGNLSLDIDNYDATAEEVSQVAQEHGGIISDSSMEKHGDGTRTGWIKVRVPAEKFFTTWEELKALGEVTNQHVSSQDVSNQYISTVSRLEVLQTEQKTLTHMLEEALEVQRTRGLGEAYSVLLQTQERLSEVNYEIQNYEDQLTRLADQITRSTITITLTERAAYQAEEWNWGYSETLSGAKKDLMMKWRWFIQGVIYFFVSGWTGLIPWIIVIIIAWLVYRRVILPRIKRYRATSNVKSGSGR